MSLFHIHLDPTAAAGGGGEPTAQPPGTFGAGILPATPAPAPVPAAPAAPPAPKLVTLTEADYLAYRQDRERLATAEAERAAELRAAAEAREEALVAKGKAEEALRLREERYKKEEGDLKTTLATERTKFRDTYLGEKLAESVAALSNLADGAAPKILRLIRDEFEVAESDGKFIVRSKAHESPAEFLKAYLADPSNACFVKASGGGGSGATGSHLSPTPATPAEPATLSEWLVQQQLANQAAPQNYLKQPRGLGPVAPPRLK